VSQLSKIQWREEFKKRAKFFFENTEEHNLEKIHLGISANLNNYFSQNFLPKEIRQSIVGIYKPMRYELPVKNILRHTQALKSVLLAYPEYNGEAMWFVEEKNLTHVIPNFFIVPGLFVDTCGNRLGRGKGYYDRYFKTCTVPLERRIFLGYPFQFVDTLPNDANDEKVAPLLFTSLGETSGLL